YLAEQGVASRREADRLIADGLISVNGKVVREMGVKVDPEKDKVTVNKKVVERQKKLIYIALNKPAGYVTSVKPTRIEKKIVMELVRLEERVFPVGRLDKDTTGLLILTNDGTLTYKLTHPSSECEKEYEVKVDGMIRPGQMDRLRAGVKLWGEKTKETQVKKIRPNRMRIVLREGKNRQIRRICQKVGLPVLQLKRIRIKGLSLGDLQEGKWRHLTPQEVQSLKQ
ncbi:rRNA pseudouridine synthase, partial [Candidatus Peregrinibacteria bacterium]|nr:rRNA pseudouridine synthase [Candidatus Peregrinibacteria bacterium]